MIDPDDPLWAAFKAEAFKQQFEAIDKPEEVLPWDDDEKESE
ncbi:MAG TPA: hypothetical protein VIR54_07055 [Vicinamibacterales bacterium]